jgi:hypothetical protein
MRSSIRTRTVSPAFLPIVFRSAALTGSLCVPSPWAINAPANGSPSNPHEPTSAEELGDVIHHHARPRTWVVALVKLGVELSQHDS